MVEPGKYRRSFQWRVAKGDKDLGVGTKALARLASSDLRARGQALQERVG